MHYLTFLFLLFVRPSIQILIACAQANEVACSVFVANGLGAPGQSPLVLLLYQSGGIGGPHIAGVGTQQQSQQQDGGKGSAAGAPSDRWTTPAGSTERWGANSDARARWGATGAYSSVCSPSHAPGTPIVSLQPASDIILCCQALLPGSDRIRCYGSPYCWVASGEGGGRGLRPQGCRYGAGHDADARHAPLSPHGPSWQSGSGTPDSRRLGAGGAAAPAGPSSYHGPRGAPTGFPTAAADAGRGQGFGMGRGRAPAGFYSRTRCASPLCHSRCSALDSGSWCFSEEETLTECHSGGQVRPAQQQLMLLLAGQLPRLLRTVMLW